MKFLKQFGIILAVSFVGEILNYFLPFPIPASIYGLLLMLLLLLTGIVKLESVRDAAKFLIEIMPPMFIPAGVGLMVKWNDLQGFLLPIIVITVVSTFVVMAVTGRVAQTLIDFDSRKKQNAQKSEVTDNAE